jgi:D-beta-D-heptose 7-phosphate kinase/D-beta-D-heptose 1-phosphate adenosyltransferase
MTDYSSPGAEQKIVCLGDVMLDVFNFGRIERISPEAPVPILLIENVEEIPGGAANVARNVASLGASCTLIGAVGEDDDATRLGRLLLAEPRLFAKLSVDHNRATTCKTRFVAKGQQVLRVDAEYTHEISSLLREELMNAFERAIVGAHAIILSDYAKGVLSQSLLRPAIEKAIQKRIPIIVDPKSHDLGRYNGATVLTPNAEEVRAATGILPITNDLATQAGRLALTRCQADAVLITKAEKGVSLIPRNGSPAHFDAIKREVFDVSGAGDTLVAALAVALCMGQNLEDASRMANAAAGIAVSKRGTAVVTWAELERSLCQQSLNAKELSLDDAKDLRESWRKHNLRVVFTNGCFDLLHPGHLRLVQFAKSRGDRLLIGINADSSVRRLKGPGRPVQSARDRAAVISSLPDVDGVIIFNEDTPLEIILRLLPDVLVKGADYNPSEIVGADLVRSYGGAIELCPLLDGHSTTRMILRAESGGVI